MGGRGKNPMIRGGGSPGGGIRSGSYSDDYFFQDTLDYIDAENQGREHLERSQLEAEQYFKSVVGSYYGSTEDRVSDIARRVASPGGRVRLADIRDEMPDVSREDLDRALFDMQDRGRVVLMHLDDPQERTERDEAARIDIMGGAFQRHILYLRDEED